MKQRKLSNEEIGNLIGMFTVLVHAAELCITPIEGHFKLVYEDDVRYRNACLIKGEEYANKKLADTVENAVRWKSGSRIGKTLKVMQQMQKALEPFTADSVTTKEGGMKADMYDCLHNDANLICRLFCLLTNCRAHEDWLKIESALKVYAKEKIISDDIIELFSPKN